MTRLELLERGRVPLPGPGERALCAVSGGLDSMCLLDMLCAWRRERGGEVVAAHFNHGLRGEAADRDESFVREVCKRWEVPLTVGRGDVRAFAGREGLSVEEAARTMRYAFLEQAAQTEGCARVYTAHHSGDNAETVLLALIRGTGLKGLAGMERCRGRICRPLLDATRPELEEYAAAWGVPHMEDETNAEADAAARNFLRLRVMPLLKELNPRAAEHIHRAAGQLRTVDRWLDEEARRRTARAQVREGRVTLPVEDLRGAPEAVRPRMLLRLIDLLGVGRRDVGSVHLDAVAEMALRTGGGRERCLRLPHGVTVRCCRDRLSLETRPRTMTRARLVPDRPLRWGDYTVTLLDRRAEGGLALRRPAEGERGAVTVAPAPPGGRLTLPGASGSRTVKRLCIDRRISLEERDRLPAVYVDGVLAAVWRLGVDTSFLPEGPGPCRTIQIIKRTEESEPW